MNKTIPEKLCELLQIGKVTIFSVSYCSYCSTAKSILDRLKIDYQLLECDDPNLTNNQIQELHKLSGFKTYPKIFVSKNCVGGCDDMRSQINSGKFFDLLDLEKIQYTKSKL